MPAIPPVFRKDSTERELKRQVKALAICSSLGFLIKRINKLRYKIRSQSQDAVWYDVVKQYDHNLGGHQEGEWTCSCPDFEYRRIVCKHIYAVSFTKYPLRRQIIARQTVPASTFFQQQSIIECKKCKSSRIVRDGISHSLHYSLQRYWCRSCGHKFTINYFKRAKASPKAVTAALDLYFKGVSLRKVCDHLNQFYGIKVTHVAVIKWIRKFADIVRPFVDSVSPPHLSGIYHVDEMMIHVRREQMEVGHYQWLWNFMDDTTRFWISSTVSQRREVKDARVVFQHAKNRSLSPTAIIHDGLKSYDEAFQKEYFSLKNPRVKNVRSISVRNQGLNSKIERLHGTIRDREKVMRGMHKAQTAQQVLDAIKIHYNFCSLAENTCGTGRNQARFTAEQNRVAT